MGIVSIPGRSIGRVKSSSREITPTESDIGTAASSQARQAQEKKVINVVQEEQEEEREAQVQQVVSKGIGLTQQELETLIWYPWGDKFASLPKDVQIKIERMHQDAIGGARERASAKVSQSDILKAVYAAQSGEFGDVKKISLGGGQSESAVQDVETSKVHPAELISKGTYDTSTGTYTDSQGNKMSMSMSNALKQGVVFINPANRMSQADMVSLETNRYVQQGYSPTDAAVLAEVSARQGGVSFTPREAEKVLNQNRAYSSNGKSNVLPLLSAGMANRPSDSNVSGDINYSEVKEAYKSKEAYKRKKQATIEAYKGSGLEKPKYSISQTIQLILGNIKEAWKKRGTGMVTAQEILEPIEYTGELKSEQEVFLTNTGEIIEKISNRENIEKYEEMGFGEVITKKEAADIYAQKYNVTEYKEMTPEAAYFKLSEDIQNKLMPEYQAKLSAGELTEEEANRQYQEAVSKEYILKSSDVRAYFIEREKLGIGERTGKDIAEAIPSTLEVAGLVALTATGAGGATLAAGYIAGMGEKDIITALTNKNLSDTQRIMLGASGSAKALLGAVGVGGTLNAIEREAQNQIIMNKLNKLNQQDIKFIGLNIQGEKGSIGVLRGYQQAGSLKTEYELAGIIKKVGSRAYFMPYGQGTATTTGTVLSTYEKEVNILLASGSQLGSKGINIPLNEKLSKVFSKDVVEDILSTGALFEKGSLGFENRIVFPTGDIITKSNKATKKLIKDLSKNARLGNEININFEETNIMRINKDWFYSETADKSVKGITKVITPEDFMQGYKFFAKPSDNIARAAMEQIQQKELETNLVNQLNKMKNYQSASIEKIINKAGAKTNKLTQVSDISAEQINIPTKSVSIEKLNVKSIEQSSDILSMGIKSKTSQRTKARSRTKQEIALMQQARNMTKEMGVQKENYQQLQKPMIKTKAVQQQMEQQPQKVNMRLKSPKPVNINDLFEPKITPKMFKMPEKREKETFINKIMKRKQKKIKQEGYTPTIEAAILQGKPLQISKKDYKKLRKKIFSGFETRPVIEIVESNRKPLDVDIDFTI